ncbi:hypothetical protein PLANTIT3_100181 [Plantibacter sp. T3]|nr:hypothetical protein PLANTIT3_100181 [Plantibacter sp. T3]
MTTSEVEGYRSLAFAAAESDTPEPDSRSGG